MIKTYEDFLPQELAEKIHNDIYKTPENWWSTAYKYQEQDTKYINNISCQWLVKNTYR